MAARKKTSKKTTRKTKKTTSKKTTKKKSARKTTRKATRRVPQRTTSRTTKIAPMPKKPISSRPQSYPRQTAMRTTDTLAMTTRGMKKPSTGIAVLALILNLIIPGLGSLIGGRTKDGIWQIGLLIGGPIVGIILTITIVGAVIGIPLIILAPIAAWGWALVSSILMIQESNY